MAIPEPYLQPAQTVGIVYWGRSGTILVHSLLDSHPDVLSCNAYFWLYSSQMDAFLATSEPKSAEKLLDFICQAFPYLFEHWPTFYPEMFRGQNRDLRFGTDRQRFVDGFREYLAHFPDGTPFDHLPEGHTVHSFVLQAINVAYALAQGQPLTSKNPTIVWQTHFWQPDYFRARFPNLRILSAVRHPLKGYDAWQVRAFVDERVPPYWYYHTVKFRQMTEHMKVPSDLASRCRALRFEDVHNRTEPAMRALASWLNIRWDKCLLESTFDGEIYWGVKGGCSHMLKAGEVAPAEAVVTGTKAFDESKMVLKYVGLADRLRMATFCEDAYENWQYGAGSRAARWLLRKCRSLLFLWPSRLDRLSFREDLRLELAKQPRSPIGKIRVISRELLAFAKKKLTFRTEMMAIQAEQKDWLPITPVYLPGQPGPATIPKERGQAPEKNTTVRQVA